MEREIWQQSAGDTERDYVDVCLDFQVILNGAGRFGEWPKCKDALINFGIEIGVDKRKKVEDIKRFAGEMKEENYIKIQKF